MCRYITAGERLELPANRLTGGRSTVELSGIVCVRFSEHCDSPSHSHQFAPATGSIFTQSYFMCDVVFRIKRIFKS